jgi:hypothetical protein
MIALNKKYLKIRANDPPALGNFIHYHLFINKIKKKEVSGFLEVLPTTLNQYFKQTSFQFSILWRISQAVQHNFILELGEELDIPFETKAEKALKAQVQILQEENLALTQENRLLKEIIKR